MTMPSLITRPSLITMPVPSTLPLPLAASRPAWRGDEEAGLAGERGRAGQRGGVDHARGDEALVGRRDIANDLTKVPAGVVDVAAQYCRLAQTRAPARPGDARIPDRLVPRGEQRVAAEHAVAAGGDDARPVEALAVERGAARRQRLAGSEQVAPATRLPLAIAVATSVRMARASASAPSTLIWPAPWWARLAPGSGCAVYCRMALTSGGVRPRLACSSNAAAPATAGAAIEVPLITITGTRCSTAPSWPARPDRCSSSRPGSSSRPPRWSRRRR